MEEEHQDASAMADAVLGQDDPPFRPPVETASEPTETSVTREADAVQDSSE